MTPRPRSAADGPAPLVLRAPAKVNLGLRVLGRRADGYHRLRTLLATIALADQLRLEPGGEGLRLRCLGDAGGGPVPDGPENLVRRAAERLEEWIGRPLPGVSIHLRKEIPAGRGLGGGSSDAAATLVGLNRLFRLGRSRAELHEIAAAIGMDVPFFLYGGFALAGGRGDAVFPLAETGPTVRLVGRSVARSAALPIVLLLPPYGIPTAEAYRGFDLPPAGGEDRREPRRPSDAPVGRITGPSGGADFLGGPSFPPAPDALRNDLERSAVFASRTTGTTGPEITEMRRALRKAGALVSAMSGSGSAVYGVFGDRSAAEEAARRLDGADFRALATRTIFRSELRAEARS